MDRPPNEREGSSVRMARSWTRAVPALAAQSIITGAVGFQYLGIRICDSGSSIAVILGFGLVLTSRRRCYHRRGRLAGYAMRQSIRASENHRLTEALPLIPLGISSRTTRELELVAQCR